MSGHKNSSYFSTYLIHGCYLGLSQENLILLYANKWCRPACTSMFRSALKISIFLLFSVAEQTGLSSTWSQTLKTGFLMSRPINHRTHGRIQRGGQGVQNTLENHVAMDFFRNTGTDPLEKQLDPFGPNCFSREVHTALCEIHC